MNEIISSGTNSELSLEIDPDDVAILPFSSGTTGLPKGVQMRHSSLVANIHQATFPKFWDGGIAHSLISLSNIYAF